MKVALTTIFLPSIGLRKRVNLVVNIGVSFEKENAMNEIQKGLFLMEEKMPCSPRAIRIGHYFLPATLGRSEQEEAAARVISFSHQLDQWVGVSWLKIVEMMKGDYGKDVAIRKNQGQGDERMDAWRRQMHRRFWLCILTLGIYGLFTREPQCLVQKEDRLNMPFSGIYLFGPQHVITGIQELLELEMLKKVTEGEGDNAIDVLFPTPALISRIMEVQGVAA